MRIKGTFQKFRTTNLDSLILMCSKFTRENNSEVAFFYDVVKKQLISDVYIGFERIVIRTKKDFNRRKIGCFHTHKGNLEFSPMDLSLFLRGKKNERLIELTLCDASTNKIIVIRNNGFNITDFSLDIIDYMSLVSDYNQTNQVITTYKDLNNHLFPKPKKKISFEISKLRKNLKSISLKIRYVWDTIYDKYDIKTYQLEENNN
jgi:hypothetical protein